MSRALKLIVVTLSIPLFWACPARYQPELGDSPFLCAPTEVEACPAEHHCVDGICRPEGWKAPDGGPDGDIDGDVDGNIDTNVDGDIDADVDGNVDGSPDGAGDSDASDQADGNPTDLGGQDGVG